MNTVTLINEKTDLPEYETGDIFMTTKESVGGEYPEGTLVMLVCDASYEWGTVILSNGKFWNSKTSKKGAINNTSFVGKAVDIKIEL